MAGIRAVSLLKQRALNAVAWALHHFGVLYLWRRFRPYNGVKVLAYHSIQKAAFTRRLLGTGMGPDQFAAQIRFLAKNYHIISIDHALAVATGETPCPANAVALSFDDGYLDTAEQAAPLLREHSLSAAVFTATGCIDGRCGMWTDDLVYWIDHTAEQRVSITMSSGEVRQFSLAGCARGAAVFQLREWLKRLPARERLDALVQISGQLGAKGLTARAEMPFMSPSDVRQLAESGWIVGSHSDTHPILTSLEPEELERELTASRELITAWTGSPPVHFAYPNGGDGDVDDAVIAALINAGFRAGWMFVRGRVVAGSDPYRLPRVGLFDMPLHRFALEMSGMLEVFTTRREPPRRSSPRR